MGINHNLMKFKFNKMFIGILMIVALAGSVNAEQIVETSDVDFGVGIVSDTIVKDGGVELDGTQPFDTDGVVESNPSAGDDRAKSIAIDSVSPI